MIEARLTEDLRNYLRIKLTGLSLPLKDGGERAPKVINGYLPPKRSKCDDDFPLILVRADGGETVYDATTVGVSIIIGIYSEDYDAHDMCLSVMAKIRQALYDLPDGTLSEKYEFRPGFSWSIEPEQPYPYWQLDIKTKWLLIAPVVKPHESTVIGGF